MRRLPQIIAICAALCLIGLAAPANEISFPTDSVKEQISQAEAFIRKKKFKQAIEIIHKLKPELNPIHYIRIARYYKKWGKRKKAKEHYTQFLNAINGAKTVPLKEFIEEAERYLASSRGGPKKHGEPRKKPNNQKSDNAVMLTPPIDDGSVSKPLVPTPTPQVPAVVGNSTSPLAASLPKCEATSAKAKMQTDPAKPDWHLQMRPVQPGAFFMEGAVSNVPSHRVPRHGVCLTRGYWLSESEVTQRLYVLIMKTNPSATISENNPVERVTFFDAARFFNKLSDLAGLEQCYVVSDNDVGWNKECSGYRFPTEAEWEYAARERAGSAFRYSGSNEADEVAWFGTTQPSEVNKKFPNRLGLYDMSGNVAEWVWDRYNGAYTWEATDPSGPKAGTERITRGGSYGGIENTVEVGCRYPYDPKLPNQFVGFRVARSFPP